MRFRERIYQLTTVLHGRWIPYILGFSVLVLALALRIMFATMAQHPGHGDAAFYYSVAENVADGRGFVIDYIWNYLSSPETITHSSNDFWMPLTSAIVGLSLFIFGKSLFAALLPSILAGLALSAVTFCFAKVYAKSRFVALGSSFLVLFLPSLFTYSLLTDSVVYYALFASSSLLCMTRGRENPGFFLLSAVLAGLAHLTRQDGLLLVPVLMVTMLLLWQDQFRTRVTYAVLSLILYVLVLSPLLVSNCSTFGAPFPPGPSRTMFMTQYEDFYVYSKELSLRGYLELGFTGIVQSKARMALTNVIGVYQLLGEFVCVFGVVGILGFADRGNERWRRMRSLPSLLFLGILFTFYTVVASFSSIGGSFMRSGSATVPFLVVIAIDAISRSISSRATVALTILALASLFLYQSVSGARRNINSNSRMGEELAALREIVTADARKQGTEEIVIMTRNPWEVYHSTGYKTIQIPNESLEIIHQVAQKYGANYLLLPAPREDLEFLYEGKASDNRFGFAASIPDSDLRLFRIK